MKRKVKTVKVVVTENVRKGLRRGDVCEISSGYANYLRNNNKIVYYSPFLEYVYTFKHDASINHDQDFHNLNIHLNKIYLNFIRVSNKSLTLYSKITKEDVFNAMKEYLMKKNISKELLTAFTNIKIDNIIHLPYIKSSNIVYELNLHGPLDGTVVYLCVGSTEEQCQQLQKGESK